MRKKGQLTIFIIIAILVISLVSVFFIILKTPGDSEGINAAVIKNFVDECVEETAEDVIYQIGQGGGHYFPPEFSTDSGIAYYWYHKKNYMPSKEELEEEISYYISKKLFFCTKNFVDFSEFEIMQREIRAKTEIKDEKVVLNVKYPLSISKGKSTTVVENFEIIIPIRLEILYNSVSEFTNEGVEEGICLSCLYDISERDDLFVDMLDYDNETVIFIFKDENSKLNNKPLEWVFANEY